MSDFHKSYCARNGSSPAKRLVKQNNVMNNLEYIDLFVKDVKIENLQTGATRQFSMRDYKVEDVEDILQAFPQDALYSEKGALKFVSDQYLKPVNESFTKHVCAACGAVHNKEGTNNPESFF